MKNFFQTIPFALLLILAVMAPSTVMANTDCSELIDKNCTDCHYKSRICKKIGTKSKRGWKISVKRMLRYGLKLDKKSQKKIVQCLTKLEKGSKLVCE